MALLLAVACATAPTVHPTLQATLWVQTAAEYRALAEQAYRGAAQSLDAALADSTWTAAVEQTAQYGGLPPAVILDIDETVLDNSPFQTRMIRKGGGFEPAMWEAWVEEARAAAVPGALEFTREADRRGVVVFYITNRDHMQEPATRRNLENLGFPIDSGRDVILTQGEREGWGSDKTSRRATIAEEYRVLLVIGDDLNDFVNARVSRAERSQLIQSYDDRWGWRWFVLPNPVYGSWENALLDFESDLSHEESTRRKRAVLSGP